MSDLSSAATWRRLLGYLPVPLFGDREENSFVLLNGGKGNFCLDVGDVELSPMEAASRAWSTDVDHYVAINDGMLRVLRWDRPSVLEKYPVETIESRVETFQRYLETKQAPRERSVVTRALQAYRSIRASSRIEQSGHEALLCFIGLLTRAWMRQQPDVALPDRWREQGEADRVARRLLGDDAIEIVLGQMLSPERGDGPHPSIPLMIRHASGRIFQEAHYLALAPIQTDLFYQGQPRLIGPASKSLGAFFTPTPLVRTLVEQALDSVELAGKTEIHIFDPACGSGEFLREAVRQLALRSFEGVVRVTGYDISPPACLMAQFGLDAESCTSPSQLSIHIEQRDALDGNPWVQDVDICLMNPPFIAWPDMSARQQDVVSGVLADLYRRRPDMAIAFLHLAIRSLRGGAAIGAVLPASFLDGTTSAPLREHLSESLSVTMTARLGNQAVFADVTVDPALFVATKKTAQVVFKQVPLLVWADHLPGSSDKALRSLRRNARPASVACVEDDEHFSIYTVRRESLEKNWAPRPYRSARLLAELQHLPKVKDLFSVQQGAITGLNSAFLLDVSEYSALPDSERKYFRRAVTNNSIVDGRLNSSTWVFYPYGRSLPSLDTEEELAARLKTFYKHRLIPYKDALIQRARITEKNWWHLSEHRKWQVDKMPKIVSTYFGKAGAFALDQSGDHVIVQGYGWVPRRAWDSDAQLLAMVAVLSAPVINVLLAGVSNNLAGGQWNLSKRFVELMPMVNTISLPRPLMAQLASFAIDIGSGTDIDKRALDELVHKAFMATM